MERMADPTLMLAAEPVLLVPEVLEGPLPEPVLVPLERTEPEEDGLAPLEVGREA